jgi:hypothetical protein
MGKIIADITAVLTFNMLGSMFVEILIAGETSINPTLIYGSDIGTETLGIKVVSWRQIDGMEF